MVDMGTWQFHEPEEFVLVCRGPNAEKFQPDWEVPGESKKEKLYRLFIVDFQVHRRNEVQSQCASLVLTF